MTTTAIRIGVLSALVCVLACGRHLNPEYCVTHGSDPECMMAGDAPMGCTSNADCHQGAFPVCDTTRHECVMCTPDQNVCHNPMPVCDSNDTCQQPMNCGSHVVLPDGTCAAETDVIYAQQGGDTKTACMQAAPCSLAEAFKHLRPRYIIHLDDGTYQGPFTFDVQDITVILFGLKATLSGGQPVVSIPTNSKVELDYVRISGGDGGVECASGATLTIHGISVVANGNGYGLTSSCTLAMDAAAVSVNPGGAIHVLGGTYEIHNTAVFNNGDSSGLRSAPVYIEAGTGHFTFNTVAFNAVKSGGGPNGSGVECKNGASTNAIGNIVVANSGANQTAGCDFTGSYTNNSAAAVLFLASPPQTAADLQLTANSPSSVKNVPGLDCSTVPTDIEGEPRPMPAGADHCDRGADEYKE